MAPPKPEDASVSTLVTEAVAATQALLRVEGELAGDELQKVLGSLRQASGLLAAGAAVVLLGLSSLLLAAVLALGARPLVAAALGGALIVLGTAPLALGARAFPGSVLDATRARLRSDLRRVEEKLP